MTARVWLYGHPVRHSVSPAMHAAAFQHLGIDARYEARDVPADSLAEALAALRQPSALGANLTVPHKEAALAWLDAVDAPAREIGAVNTVRNDAGQLVGHNTDAPGFLAALAEAGVGELFILNRNPARAVALAQSLVVRFGARPYWALPLDAPEALAYLADCALVVNATTVGLHDAASPLPRAALRPEMLVVDIIYNPPRTPLLADAEAAGARTQNGLPMLVHQAALAFALWTGRPAPLHVMRAAAEAALARQDS